MPEAGSAGSRGAALVVPPAIFVSVFAARWVMDRPLETYFFGDSWDVLYSLFSVGWPAIFWPHNEHFMPLFKGFYYLEYLLFAMQHVPYAVMAIVLHSLNTLLVYSLAAYFSPHLPARIAAALMFGVSRVYQENTAWTFQHTFLLSFGFLLLSLWALARYAEAGHPRVLTLSVLSAFASYLSASFGLLAPLLLTGYWTLVVPKAQRRGKGLRVLMLAWGSLVVYVGLYVLANGFSLIPRQGEFTRMSVTALAPARIAGYLFNGVVRGLLLPTLTVWRPFQGATVEWAVSLLFLGGLLYVFLVTGRETRRKVLFLLGFLVVPYLLAAVGRLHLGTDQAASSRYQYLPLVPVSLGLGMAVEWSRNCRAPRFRRLFLIGFTLFASYYVAAHLYAGRTYNWMAGQGHRTREFFASVLGALPADVRSAGSAQVPFPALTLPAFAYPWPFPVERALTLFGIPPGRLQILAPEPLRRHLADVPNLLANAGFETGLDPWVRYGSEASLSGMAHSGRYAASVTFLSPLSAFSQDALRDGGKGLRGRLFVYSVYVQSGTPEAVRARLIFKDGRGAFLAMDQSPPHTGGGRYELLSVNGIAPRGTSTVGVDVVGPERFPATALVDDAILALYPVLSQNRNP